MSLPESMSRVVIVGSKPRLEETVDALYEMGIVHLIDYTNDSDEGFAIGAPLSYSPKASERLLKIRAVEKDLGIKARKAKTPSMVLSDVKAEISSGNVEAVEQDVLQAIDKRNSIAQKITELDAIKSELKILEKLPLKLEDYSGYSSLSVFVGTVKEDCSAALAAVPNTEVFVSAAVKNERPSIAVFVKNEDKAKVSAILSENNYIEAPVPAGEGAPADVLAKIEAEILENQNALEEAKAAIVGVSEKYKKQIVAYDEELTDEVRKGETPLRIATTEFSFVVDAWVPTAKVEMLEKGVKDLLGDGVYVEFQETRGRNMHESEHVAEKEGKRFEVPPSKWNNGPVAKRYQYATSLISVPKYQEIDPSIAMAIFFPLFFGFMIGDLAYAIPFICLGAYGLKHAKSKEFQAIGTVLFYGGIWAALFGFFFFGEMLGMHFVGEATETTLTWEALLGVSLPDWFSGIMIDAGHGHYGVSKLGSSTITMLLKLTVYVGIVHLLVSYAIGFMNIKMQHGMKHAMQEKGGWFIMVIGVSALCFGLSGLMGIQTLDSTVALVGLIVGVIALVIGVVLAWPAEGIQAILEIPGIVGNILSYTRLAAIGMSKAGMALAFNYIALVMLGGFGPYGDGFAIGGFIAGALVFVIGHLMIWVLGILSAGLHALRLQYVESMNKFFVGGGVEYAPLKTSFKHIINKPENIDTEA